MSVSKIRAALLALLIFISAVAGTPAALADEQRAGIDPAGGGSESSYRVKTGDCLWSVSRKFRVSVGSLARANNLPDDSLLFAGQRLTIPGTKTNAAEARVKTLGEALLAAEQAAAEAELESFEFWPVTGAVTSVFGPRRGRMHQGLDIAVEEGKPIRSLAAGTIIFAGERGDYGNAVIISHGNGVQSLYAHASALEVAEGEYVEQGQIIAQAGTTGKSTGPHLHLEVRYQDTPMNPVNYLPCIAQN